MSLAKIARNAHGDDVLKLFGPLAHRITSDHWAVYADQGQFERLRRGEKNGAVLSTFSLLKPSAMQGFASVTVASACIGDTMWFRLWTALGAPMKPVGERLRRTLRYAQHPHGERIAIYYAAEEAWSKTYRDRLVADRETGGTFRLIERVRQATLALLTEQPFLWMGNVDLDDAFFGTPRAKRLPNTPHGLNTFQGVHDVVVLSALNPPPQHFGFLESYGISGDEVRTAHYRTAVYQAVMRCSIRNPADPTPKRVVVMDRETAEWLAALFPGAATEPLPGMGVVPRKGRSGRPRLHADDAAKARAHRARKEREYLAQLDLVNGTSLEVGRYPWFADEVRAGMSEFARYDISYKEGVYVTPMPSPTAPVRPASPPSTCGTVYASIYEAKPLDHVDHTDDDLFIAHLRDLHGRVVAKEEAGVFAPAHFDPDKAEETSRGLANVTHVRGIWLDNDGGDLTPDAFADLFPYLRVVTWNTASSTPETPRWRAFIPTTYAMSIEVHRLIMAQIERVLNRAGYWGKRQVEKRNRLQSALRHGFDESKFNAASLFYLPCQSRHPNGSFFADYGDGDPKRGPLDLHQWIERCILDLRPESEPSCAPARMDPENRSAAVAADSATVPSPASTASRLSVVRAKLLADGAASVAARQETLMVQAIERWRSATPGSGHHAFFVLGAALHRAGLDEWDIRAKLNEEAAYASSPKERRGEIKGILKKLRERGSLPRGSWR